MLFIVFQLTLLLLSIVIGKDDNRGILVMCFITAGRLSLTTLPLQLPPRLLAPLPLLLLCAANDGLLLLLLLFDGGKGDAVFGPLFVVDKKRGGGPEPDWHMGIREGDAAVPALAPLGSDWVLDGGRLEEVVC